MNLDFRKIAIEMARLYRNFFDRFDIGFEEIDVPAIYQEFNIARKYLILETNMVLNLIDSKITDSISSEELKNFLESGNSEEANSLKDLINSDMDILDIADCFQVIEKKSPHSLKSGKPSWIKLALLYL